MISQYGRGPGWPYANPYPSPYSAQHYPTQPAPMMQQAAQQLLPPWLAQMGPQLVPVTFQQPGMQMPAYLTVPEPINPEEHWMWRLVREIFRSMVKSTGHTAASFIDHNPLRAYEIPPEPQPPVLPPPAQQPPQQK
jgi:hypothetical protein